MNLIIDNITFTFQFCYKKIFKFIIHGKLECGGIKTGNFKNWGQLYMYYIWKYHICLNKKLFTHILQDISTYGFDLLVEDLEIDMVIWITHFILIFLYLLYKYQINYN